MPPPIRDNTVLSRYELDSDGMTAVLNYKIAGGVITMMHTESPAQIRGRGIASQLVRGALEAARARGLKVVPRCPFVSGYIARHPEFRDLLT